MSKHSTPDNLTSYVLARLGILEEDLPPPKDASGLAKCFEGGLRDAEVIARGFNREDWKEKNER